MKSMHFRPVDNLKARFLTVIACRVCLTDSLVWRVAEYLNKERSYTMNTTIHKSWGRNLYLDALGSSAVIAASVLIFLSVAVTTATGAIPENPRLVDACPTARLAAVEYADQRPGAARNLGRLDCA